MRYRRTIVQFALTAAGALGLSMIVCLLADPYDIFCIVDKRGFNVTKNDDLADHSRVTKSMKVIRYKPQRILLGSSVVDSGFLLPGALQVSYGNPPALLQQLPPSDRKLYLNTAIRGGGLYEEWKMLQHAYANNPKLDYVLLGVEWGQFTDAKPPIPGNPDVPAIGATHMPPGVFFERTLTWRAFADSCYVIYFNALKPVLRSIRESWEAHADETARPMILHGDLPVLARGSWPQSRAFYFSAWDLTNRLSYKRSHGTLQLSPAIDYMRRIVDFCREHHIKLDVYVSPQSALYWAVADANGMGPDVDKWLATLAAITPYYDFSGLVDFSDRQDDYFMNDPLHFDESVGALIFSRVLAGDPAHQVTAETAAADIARRHVDLAAWLSRNAYYNDILPRYRLDPWKSDWPNILPTRYDPDIAGRTVIGMHGTFYAMPGQPPYDLRTLLSGGYGAVTAPTVEGLKKN